MEFQRVVNEIFLCGAGGGCPAARFGACRRQSGRRPGGLDDILQVMTKNGINVEYMYAFVTKSAKSATMIFRFDKTDDAIDVLQKSGFTILSPETLCAI